MDQNDKHNMTIPVYRVFDKSEGKNVYFQELEDALDLAEYIDSKVEKLKLTLDSAERLFK